MLRTLELIEILDRLDEEANSTTSLERRTDDDPDDYPQSPTIPISSSPESPANIPEFRWHPAPMTSIDPTDHTDPFLEAEPIIPTYESLEDHALEGEDPLNWYLNACFGLESEPEPQPKPESESESKPTYLEFESAALPFSGSSLPSISSRSSVAPLSGAPTPGLVSSFRPEPKGILPAESDSSPLPFPTRSLSSISSLSSNSSSPCFDYSSFGSHTPLVDSPSHISSDAPIPCLSIDSFPDHVYRTRPVRFPPLISSLSSISSSLCPNSSPHVVPSYPCTTSSSPIFVSSSYDTSSSHLSDSMSVLLIPASLSSPLSAITPLSMSFLLHVSLPSQRSGIQSLPRRTPTAQSSSWRTPTNPTTI